ncbi:MAG: DoxX family protein [Pseudomonadota bacterium]
MNLLLWIFQIVLALLSIAGGAYKLFAYADLAKMPATAALPQFAWGALGLFELACGLLLVVPPALKWMPVLTPLAAAALALESLGLVVLYSRYSTQLAPSNPLVWVALMAVLAVLIAYGRSAR